MSNSATIKRRLEALEQRRQRQKGPLMPFIDFYMPDGGPGCPEGESYEDFIRAREQAIRDGRPIFGFTLPGDLSDTQQIGDCSHG